MGPFCLVLFLLFWLFETDLKIKGMYGEYERAIMQGNYEAWLAEIQAEYKEWLQTPEGHRFITESGQVEDWSLDTKQATSEKISNYISRISTEFKESIDDRAKATQDSA